MFYVINIQNEAQSIFKYDTEDKAYVAFHSTCFSNRQAFIDGTLSSYTVVIINQSGDVIVKEFKFTQEG